MKTPTSLFSSARQHRQGGFTLIELLVALSIAAILLAVGVPSFRASIASNRLTSTTNDLVASLAQARSEAIKRGTRVTVCISSDGAACATTGSWEQGWISFVDITRSGTTAKVETPGSPVADDVVLAVTQRAASTTTIKGSAALVQYVSFSSDGTSRTMLGAPQGGTLRVCEPSSALTNANRARDIDVSSVGRLITTTPPNTAASCPAP